MIIINIWGALVGSATASHYHSSRTIGMLMLLIRAQKLARCRPRSGPPDPPCRGLILASNALAD